MITERTTGGSQALSKMISKIMNGTWKPLLPKFSAAQYLTLEGSRVSPIKKTRIRTVQKAAQGNQLKAGRRVNDRKSKANNECKLPKFGRNLAARMQS